MGSGETHLLYNTLPCADGAPIVELILRKVRLGCGGPVLDLVYRPFKPVLTDGHLSELEEGVGKFRSQRAGQWRLTAHERHCPSSATPSL